MFSRFDESETKDISSVFMTSSYDYDFFKNCKDRTTKLHRGNGKLKEWENDIISVEEMCSNQPQVELEDVIVKILSHVSAKRRKKSLKNGKLKVKKRKSNFVPRVQNSANSYGLRTNLKVVERFQSPAKDLNQSSDENESDELTQSFSPNNKTNFANEFDEEDSEIIELCLSCGTSGNISASHPFFEGSICMDHDNLFKESYHKIDSDGNLCYCAICCEGQTMVMCDEPNCDKVFCRDCLVSHGSEEIYQDIVDSDKWVCLLCDDNNYGRLVKRSDWKAQLERLKVKVLNTLPPVPIDKRRPIRVLSLFDGIATGIVALKELGLEIGKFVASEIDEDAIRLVQNRHPEVIHVGSICHLTEDKIKELGPFDLVMGGSPCNDLSGANPKRQGLLGPSGCLFFDFFRVWKISQPSKCSCNADTPFFWIFENVVSMRNTEKEHISRFLNSSPIVANAAVVSAAKRQRFFWGNLPGMANFKLTPTKRHHLTVQSCLEPGRTATVEKLNTITAQPKSLFQGKYGLSPVLHDGTEDTLWTTEIERIFGVPEHYTDVNNLGPRERLGLLGRSWSVPVVKQLFAPLTQYFSLK